MITNEVLEEICNIASKYQIYPKKVIEIYNKAAVKEYNKYMLGKILEQTERYIRRYYDLRDKGRFEIEYGIKKCK